MLISLSLIFPLAIVFGVIYFLVRVSRGEKADGNTLTLKEVAVDAGIFLSLITSIVALVSIIFSAIDKKFVDVLNTNYYGSGTAINEDIRVAVSIILVAYPIYVGLAYFKAKYLKNNAERRNLKAVKYVNYITLGVAALFIIGSLITTIYEYLGGELGLAFFYKMLTVVAIALVLAFYNYYSIHRDYSKKSNTANTLALLSLLAILASVIYSVSILGSPAQVRKIKFDEKRLTDLSNIQNEILNHWTKAKTLPASISNIQGDGFSNGFVMPTDPSTKEAYKYNIVEDSKMVKAAGRECAAYYPNKFNNGNYYDVNKLYCDIPTKAVFEICANFETVRAYDENGMDQSGSGWDNSNILGVKSLDIMSARYYEPTYYDSYNKNPNWNHDAGYKCFKRTIDPVKYPQY